MTRCDWQYEINLPLECFLSGSKPEPPLWVDAGMLVVVVAALCVVGAFYEWLKK